MTPIAAITTDTAESITTEASTSPVQPVGSFPEIPTPEATPEPESESEFTMRPIPDISEGQLARSFEIDLNNVEVTSMDVVSHGCYVFAGCSNGIILLFDLSSNSK